MLRETLREIGDDLPVRHSDGDLLRTWASLQLAQTSNHGVRLGSRALHDVNGRVGDARPHPFPLVRECATQGIEGAGQLRRCSHEDAERTTGPPGWEAPEKFPGNRWKIRDAGDPDLHLRTDPRLRQSQLSGLR